MRAGRALLRWTALDLAAASKVGVATIRRVEVVDGEIPVTSANEAAIRRAFESAGVEFIEELRKQHPAIPVILISGFVDTLGLNESTTGANAVIQKSANEVSRLIRAVSRLLRAPARKPAGSQTREKRRRTGVS